jgi:hypothetical protein
MYPLLQHQRAVGELQSNNQHIYVDYDYAESRL